MFTEKLVEAAKQIGKEMDNLHQRNAMLELNLEKEKTKTKDFAEILRQAIARLEQE